MIHLVTWIAHRSLYITLCLPHIRITMLNKGIHQSSVEEVEWALAQAWVDNIGQITSRIRLAY